MCVHYVVVEGYACHGAPVEVKGQLCGVCLSFHFSTGSQNQVQIFFSLAQKGPPHTEPPRGPSLSSTVPS